MERMKDGALLANSGHFDVEINKSDLEALSVRHAPRKPNIEGYYLPDGRILNLLAEGRLVNLAAGNGHPAEIMDMSFGLQALCLDHIAGTLKSGVALDKRVYPVPCDIDARVASLKLTSLGVSIDALTKEQVEYLNKVD